MSDINPLLLCIICKSFYLIKSRKTHTYTIGKLYQQQVKQVE